MKSAAIVFIGAAAFFGSAEAGNTSEETIGMLVMEALGATTSDRDASRTGIAFLDTIEKLRHGGKVEIPDTSCGTPECVGTYMAIEAARDARRASARARR